MKSIFSSALTTISATAFFATPAFASSKKTTTPAAATSARPGTLVAMSGSGSLSAAPAENEAYVGFRLFPLSFIGGKYKEGNVSVDTPSTVDKTFPKQVFLYGKFGSWVLRPTLNLDVELQGGELVDSPSLVSLGYMFAPNLELGGILAFDRLSSESDDKTKSTASTFLIGPQAVYHTEVASFPLELEGRLVLIFRNAEKTSTNTNTTVTSEDTFGYGFEVGANTIRELSSSLDYVAGVSFSYSTQTNKADKNKEITVSATDFTIVPAGLRFKF